MKKPSQNDFVSASSEVSSARSFEKASARSLISFQLSGMGGSSAARRTGNRRYNFRAAMKKSRLEAFSDGVIAILITIMVLEFKVPAGAGWRALAPLAPLFSAYLLSFLYLGIYWNNHHHLLHTVERVSGGILWANLHLLFWLSLFPFATAWMGGHRREPVPAAAYGVALLGAAIAYFILVQAILRTHGPGSLLKKAIGDDFKGKLSIVLYAAAIALAFLRPWLAHLVFAVVAAIWLVPDRRIERSLAG